MSHPPVQLGKGGFYEVTCMPAKQTRYSLAPSLCYHRYWIAHCFTALLTVVTGVNTPPPTYTAEMSTLDPAGVTAQMIWDMVSPGVPPPPGVSQHLPPPNALIAPYTWPELPWMAKPSAPAAVPWPAAPAAVPWPAAPAAVPWPAAPVAVPRPAAPAAVPWGVVGSTPATVRAAKVHDVSDEDDDVTPFSDWFSDYHLYKSMGGDYFDDWIHSHFNS